MTTHYLLGRALHRPQNLSTILCTSGTLVLWIAPHQIIDPSFSLSYAALMGLTLFSRLPVPKQAIAGTFLKWTYASLGSSLATLPFAAHYFKELYRPVSLLILFSFQQHHSSKFQL